MTEYHSLWHTDYTMYGVTLSESQAKKIISSAMRRTAVVIRLTHNKLQGKYKLPLTQTQIAQINKADKLNKGMDLELSAAQLEHIAIQLEHMEKRGGLLPLAALLPIIFSGLGAASAVAGGAASAVSAANNAKAAAAAQAETERHNREVEATLKTGTGTGGGVVSDLVGKTPLIGSYLKPLLQKIGLGTKDCNKVMKGGCVCMKEFGKGLYLRPYGGGLFIGPPKAYGNGLFLGPEKPAA